LPYNELYTFDGSNKLNFLCK